MNSNRMPLLGGGLLIIVGLALLLQNFGLVQLGNLWAAFWAVLFAVGGAAFLWFFLKDAEQWWALIPGFALLGLATLVGMGLVLPGLADVIGAPIFLAAIGLGFLAVYVVRREMWWALIPGGVLASIAAMVFLEEAFPGRDWVSVMFMGMAATFALVAALPTEDGDRNTWAFIPAGVLLLVGLFMFAPALNVFAIVGPLALIIGGGYLLFRTISQK